MSNPRAALPHPAETPRDAEPYGDAANLPRRPIPAWGWVLATAVLFAASLIGAALVPAGTRSSLWWPAAGVGVAFALLLPRTRIPAALGLVWSVTSVANLVAGRPLDLALAWGVVNTVEVAVVLGVLGAWSRPFRIVSLRAALRFVLAAVAGGLAAGVLGAGAIALLVDGPFWPNAPFIVASHAAAVVMIAPFAALPRRLPVRAGRPEMLAQASLLGLVIAGTFHPDVSLPLGFALIPFVVWAAFRFPIRVVLTETLVASLAMLGLTLAGGGPFSADSLDPTMRAALLELFLVTVAGVAVVLTAAQYQLRAVSRSLDASALLLGGSLVDARIGLAIAQRECPGIRVIWTNPAARRLLAPELGAADAWDGPIADAATRALAGAQATVTTADGSTVTVAANAIVGDEERFAVQLLDVTAILHAEHARVEAEIERESVRSIRAELERQRDDFLATTSHELRTPITSIVGYSELLSEAEGLPAAQRAWVTVIERNAHRLAELVEDLLTLSGAATAPSRHHPSPIRCSELCDEVVANLRLVSDATGLEVTVDASDAVAMGARDDIVRALSNLLVNAIKFTPPGGRVRITARDEVGTGGAGTVLLSIADTGPGMDEDEIAHAFERFYRAPAAERGNVPGAGLGLPIVAELARRNGGRVALRRNDDGGLTAELRLVAGRSA